MEPPVWHNEAEAIYRHILYVTGAIGAILGFWQRAKMKELISRAWNKTFGRTHAIILASQTEQDKKISEILDQVRPNGHGSIQEQLFQITDTLNDQYGLFFAKLDADGDALILTDAEGHLTWVTQGYKELTGWDLERVAGHGWESIIHEDDLARVVHEWENVVENKIEWSMTFRIRCALNKVKKVHARIHRNRDRQTGEVRGYLAKLVELIEE